MLKDNCVRVGKLVLSILVTIGLGACGSTYKVGYDDKFTSQNKDALLILGFNSIGSNYDQVLQIEKIDPGTKTPLPSTGKPIYAKSGIWMSLNDNRGPDMNVLRLAPGAYAIKSVAGSFERGAYGPGSYVMRMRPATWSFELKAGEATYVGNFAVELKRTPGKSFLTRPAIKLYFMDGQAANATKHMSNHYKNVGVSPVYLPAQKIKLNLPMSK